MVKSKILGYHFNEVCENTWAGCPLLKTMLVGRPDGESGIAVIVVWINRFKF